MPIVVICVVALLAGPVARRVNAQKAHGEHGADVVAGTRGVIEPDEEIVLTPMPNPIVQGGQLTLTLKVRNLSPTDSVDSANVTTTTPEGTTFSSAAASQGAVDAPDVGGS
jgi:uncharacterized repeat protein (TIGR01451 family)